MEAHASDGESEGSGISNVDRAYSPIEDGPGPSRNGETVVVSDESDYSGVTNEDDEDFEDGEGMEWPLKEEWELTSIKEEDLSADEEIYLAEGVEAEDLLSAKEEILSDASDFAGFDGPSAKRRKGLTGGNFTKIGENKDDDDWEVASVKTEDSEECLSPDGDWRGGAVKIEEYISQDVDFEGAPPGYHSSNAASQLRCIPIETTVKKHLRPLTSKIFHCYYCPQVFKMKAYLPRHVRQHLRDGDPKYEVGDANGRKVHPAYIKGTVWPVRQNVRNQKRPLKPWRGRTLEVYHCYYCPVYFRVKPSLRVHVVNHLAKGDPKFEVPDSSGNMVHPSYLEERRLPQKNENSRNVLPSAHKTFACHLCDFKTKHVSVLRMHLMRKAKQPKTPFTCFHCNWTTKRLMYLQHHMRRHLPKMYKCEFCSYTALEAGLLKVHLRLHTGEKPYKCDFCDEQFTQKCHQKRHLIKHKATKRRCPHCTFLADTGKILSEHIIAVHLGLKNYGCPKCRFETDDTMVLRSHVRSIHRMKLEKLKCRWCDFQAAKSASIRNHERSHTEPEGFACDECAFTTKSKDRIKTHKWTHTGEKPFACELCDFRTTSKKSVERHMVTHTDEKPFKCSHCVKIFKTKQTAQSHELYVHRLMEKRFRCQYCSHETYHKTAMIRHEACHTAERTLKCPECDYVGRWEANLKIHMRSHARGGDHKCDICNFRSMSANGISSHMQVVHPTAKPYMCTYCSATFKYKPEVIDHERSHTGEKKRLKKKGVPYKRFKCRFCYFETVPFKKIKSHYEEVHPDKLETEIIPELAEREAQNASTRKQKPKTLRKCRFCPFESTARRRVRIHEWTHEYEMAKEAATR